MKYSHRKKNEESSKQINERIKFVEEEKLNKKNSKMKNNIKAIYINN
tara:strand:+ start:490 stop:630 length:141 start_codon:yes stop_codon:yes gene_type:complete